MIRAVPILLAAVLMTAAGCVRPSIAPRWCFESVAFIPDDGGAACQHRSHKASLARNGMLICRCPGEPRDPSTAPQ